MKGGAAAGGRTGIWVCARTAGAVCEGLQQSHTKGCTLQHVRWPLLGHPLHDPQEHVPRFQLGVGTDCAGKHTQARQPGRWIARSM